MKKTELDAWLREQIDAFSGKVSLLMTDLINGKHYHSFDPDTQVVSASTIKVPILLYALEQVRQKRLSLEQAVPVPAESILPDTEVFELGLPEYSLWELLYWMIVESDNTATNLVLDLLNWDEMNAYFKDTLGLKHTVCQRKMLDWDAVAAGKNNYTSAADQERIYWALYRGTILTHDLQEKALDMLRRQRCNDSFLRYIPQPVVVAHKTGGLDHVNHDAGIFELFSHPFYLGIFTWDGPALDGQPDQKRFIGKLAKQIYEIYG